MSEASRPTLLYYQQSQTRVVRPNGDRRRRTFHTRYVTWLLLMLNLIALLVAASCVCIGVWLASVHRPLERLVGDDATRSTAVLLSAVGAVAAPMLVLGTFAAYKRFKCCLMVYMVCMVCIGCAALVVAACGVASAGNGDGLDDTLLDGLLTDYGHPEAAEYTAAWEHVQSSMHCCGVNATHGPAAYALSDWYGRQGRSPRWRVAPGCCATCRYVHETYCVDEAAGDGEAACVALRTMCSDASLGRRANVALCRGELAPPLGWPEHAILYTSGCAKPLAAAVRGAALALAGAAFALAACSAILTGVSWLLYRWSY